VPAVLHGAHTEQTALGARLTPARRRSKRRGCHDELHGGGDDSKSRAALQRGHLQEGAGWARLDARGNRE